MSLLGRIFIQDEISPSRYWQVLWYSRPGKCIATKTFIFCQGKLSLITRLVPGHTLFWGNYKIKCNRIQRIPDVQGIATIPYLDLMTNWRQNHSFQNSSFAYCPVYKAASSNWFSYTLELAGISSGVEERLKWWVWRCEELRMMSLL